MAHSEFNKTHSTSTGQTNVRAPTSMIAHSLLPSTGCIRKWHPVTVKRLRFKFSSWGKKGKLKKKKSESRAKLLQVKRAAGQPSAGLSNDWTATNSDGPNV